MLADLRYALRILTKRPGFVLVAVLTIALGIGVNTAIFSAVDSVLLRPLPFKDPESLMAVWEHTPVLGIEQNQFAPANYFDLRKQNQTFADVGAFGPLSINLTGAGEPEQLEGQLVTANVLPLLGISPALGRTFANDEDQSGHEHVVVLSDALWRRRFNRDPGIVNRSVTLNGESFTVVGVMPPNFFFPERETELWLPWAMEPGQAEGRGDHYFRLVARLKPGISRDQANAEAEAIAARLAAEYPRTNEGLGFVVNSFHKDYVGDLRRPMLILFAAVGLVLLIVGVPALLCAAACEVGPDFSIPVN